jgi:hypothetical protein
MEKRKQLFYKYECNPLDSYIKNDESPSFKGSNISPIKIDPIKNPDSLVGISGLVISVL